MLKPIAFAETYSTQPKPGSKRILWKWSLVATGILAAFLMWQCLSGLVQAGRLSDPAVAEFHRRMNAGDFEAIYSHAGEAFQQA